MHLNPEVLALLALGEHEGTPAEREHAATCAVCAPELAELDRLVSAARSSETTPLPLQSPPEAVWSRIEQELGLATAPSAPQRRIRPSAPRRTLSLALAAVVALIAGVGIGLGWDRVSRPAGTVIGNADLTALPAWSGAAGTARVERDASGQRFLVVSMTTARPVTGDQQVWLINTGVTGMQSLGFLTAPTDRFAIPSGLDLAAFPIVDVSEEPNDADSTHSGNSIVRGTLRL